jgi:hypothetical protein
VACLLILHNLYYMDGHLTLVGFQFAWECGDTNILLLIWNQFSLMKIGLPLSVQYIASVIFHTPSVPWKMSDICQNLNVSSYYFSVWMHPNLDKFPTCFMRRRSALMVLATFVSICGLSFSVLCAIAMLHLTCHRFGLILGYVLCSLPNVYSCN